jgi:hypothetical protein
MLSIPIYRLVRTLYANMLSGCWLAFIQRCQDTISVSSASQDDLMDSNASRFMFRGTTSKNIPLFFRAFSLFYILLVQILIYILCTDNFRTPLIYLSAWHVYLALGYFTIGTIQSRHIFYSISSENAQVNPLALAVFWVLQNVTAPISLLVVMGYWVFFHPKSVEDVLIGIHGHGVVSSLVLVDVAISNIPLFLYHVWHSLLLLFVYGIFAFIYEFSGGYNENGDDFIYKPLNFWTDDRHLQVKPFILACLTFAIVAPLSYVFVWCMKNIVYVCFPPGEYKRIHSSSTIVNP